MRRALVPAAVAGLLSLGCAGHRITPVYVTTPAPSQLSLVADRSAVRSLRVPTAFDVLYRNGDYGSAVEAFATDGRLHTEPSALLRMALLHADPTGGRYDPAGAADHLQRLIDIGGDTEREAVAAVLLRLLDGLQGARARTASLERQLEELKAIDLRDPP